MILCGTIVERWTNGPSFPIEKLPANTKGRLSIFPQRYLIAKHFFMLIPDKMVLSSDMPEP